MAWYDADWTYRVKITAQSAEVDEDVTNWAYYIDLSRLPAGFWSNVDTNGEDVRVTQSDGTTEVAIDLVDFDGVADTGSLFFKHNASSTGNVDYYVYYGASGKSLYADNATYGKYNVWSSLYDNVYQLTEESTSAGAIKNSTQDDHHGTYEEGGETGGGSVSGKLEKNGIYLKQTFPTSANDNRISFDDDALEFSFPATLLCWYKVDDLSESGRVLCSDYYASGNSKRFYWFINEGVGLRVWKSENGSSGVNVDSGSGDFGSGDYNTWMLLASTINSAGTTCTHYKDASNIGSGSLTNSTLYNNATVGYIGAYAQSGALTPQVLSDANFDMLMIANTEWSGNRVATWYNMTHTPGSFWSVGTQESAPASFTPKIVINI